MSTPRIPPLRIIDSPPRVMTYTHSAPREYQQPSRVLGFIVTLMAFACLCFGFISAEKIYPLFHLPIWSEIAIFISFPTMIYGVVRLG